jgi:hypothetical protein
MKIPPPSSWMVFTTNGIYDPDIHTLSGGWHWVAYGPEGSQAGMEASSEEAVAKARAAQVVLADLKRS